MNIYTPISSQQLKNTKVYSNRWDWVLTLPNNLSIIEIGTGSGDFAEHIITNIKPNKMILIDKFNESDPLLARPGFPPRFCPDTQYDFVKNRFINNSNVSIISGLSQNVLPDLINNKLKFDLIYIDASHDYQDVLEDINNASRLLKDDGIMAINDYVYFVNIERYGVIEATNQFLNENKDWQVIGFALEERMLSDIYLSKHPQ